MLPRSYCLNTKNTTSFVPCRHVHTSRTTHSRPSTRVAVVADPVVTRLQGSPQPPNQGVHFAQFPLPLDSYLGPDAATLKPLSLPPFLLLIPDLDGVGLTSARQLGSLSRAFELHVTTLPPKPGSQSTFQQLVNEFKEHLEKCLAGIAPERPVYVLGEGFGAVVALALAMECRSLINRLVLVNPSTSYTRSPMARLGPLLAQLPPPLYSAMPLVLAPALGNPQKIAAEIFTSRQPDAVAVNALKALIKTIEQLQQISKNLPPETLKHRLELLEEGVKYVTPRLGDVEPRTMILCGGQDLVLPSEEEGKRLKQQLPRAFTKVLPQAGHALLQEVGVDLVQLMQEEGFYIRQRTFTTRVKPGSVVAFGSAGPAELPTPEELQRVRKDWTGIMRQVTSPVFLSTLADGTLVEGLEGIPTDKRPILFIGNHQLYALDMAMMVEEVLLKRGILLRGLAHPGVFRGSRQGEDTEEELSSAGTDTQTSSNTGTSSSTSSGDQRDFQRPPAALSDVFLTYGAVKVSPTNFFRLMQNGEAVLLYPGGVREGFKRRGEKYELFWPTKQEFVRLAAKFGATIVPVSSIGVEDSINIVMDTDDMMQHPWFGSQLRQLSANAPKARAGSNDAPEVDQSFVPPIIAPNIPSRMYVMFGKPIHLSKQVAGDREACQDVYANVRSEVQEGIAYLLERREEDPYKDFIKRVMYENSPLAGKRQAPTFPL